MKTCFAAALMNVVLVAGPVGTNQTGVLLRAAQQLFQQRDYAGAERILLGVLEEEKKANRDGPIRALALNDLGAVYDLTNRSGQAESCYRQAMELEDRLWGNDPHKPIGAISNLAAIYVATGQYGKAERLGLVAVAERSLKLHPDNLDVARIFDTLGVLDRRRGRTSAAEQDFLIALQISQKESANRLATMQILNNLGVLYIDTNRYQESLRCYQRALSIARNSLDENDPMQAQLLSNAASLEFLLHGPKDAEPLFRNAIIIAENSLGEHHSIVGQILVNYAHVLRRMNKKKEAKECERRAQSIQLETTADPYRRHTVDLSDLARRSGKH